MGAEAGSGYSLDSIDFLIVVATPQSCAGAEASTGTTGLSCLSLSKPGLKSSAVKTGNGFVKKCLLQILALTAGISDAYARAWTCKEVSVIAQKM
jgi:hypothetical protein